VEVALLGIKKERIRVDITFSNPPSLNTTVCDLDFADLPREYLGTPVPENAVFDNGRTVVDIQSRPGMICGITGDGAVQQIQ
jgi:hypothetical protein